MREIRALGLVALIAGMLASAPAFAGAGATANAAPATASGAARKSAPPTGPADRRDSPVSTPPETAAPPDPISSTTPETGPAPTLPLTRAATRERIDRMSPIGWLSRYGAVTAARPD